MELSRGDGSLGVLLGVQAGLAMRSIASFGSEEQKQRWLPPMARMDALGAFALTEPDHGSDSVSLETTARLDGEHVRDRRQQAVDRQRLRRRCRRRLGSRCRGRPGQGLSRRARHAGFRGARDRGQGKRALCVAGTDRARPRAGPGRRAVARREQLQGRRKGPCLDATDLCVLRPRARRRLIRRGAQLLPRIAANSASR